MKRSTLLSTAAVLALSTTFALAQGAQREQRQEPSNAPAAQQQAPSRAPQASEPANQGGARSQQPTTQSPQAQSQPQQPANQNAQREPAQAQPNNRSAQQPAQQNNTNSAQREPAQAQPNNRSAQQPAQQNNTNNAQRESSRSNQPAQNNAQTNQQPAQRGAETTQSGQSRQSAQITTQQRTRIASSIRQQNIAPVRVNFALNVGVAVPSSVHLAVLPDTIISIVPQYRGYSYFVTDERIVIVEPSSHHIVEVLPYEGGGRAAAAPARSEHRAQFSKEQRSQIRNYAVQKQRAVTTGSGPSRRIVVDEEVPSAVVLDEFPETVVREVPSVRTYRYYRQDDDVVVVDPGSRRVIDVIE